MSLIPKQFLSGAFWSAFSALLVGVCGYLTRRFMANSLPGNDYAFFYSTMALLNLVMIVVHLGTSDVLLYELPGMLVKNQHRRARCTYHYTLRLQLFLAVICILLLIAITPFLKKYYFDYPVNNIYLWLFFLLLLGGGLENAVLFTLNSAKKFLLTSLLRAIKAVAFMAATVIFLRITDFTLLGIILSMVLITTLCTLYGGKVIAGIRIFGGVPVIPSSIKHYVLKGGAVFILLSSGYTLIQDFGTFSLSFFSTANEVVLFNIALPISMIVVAFTVVMQVFTPMFAEAYYNREYKRLKTLFKLLFLLTTTGALLALPVLYFMGDFIITLLFSEKFITARWATLFLVEAAILSIPIRAFLSFFNAIGLRNISVKSLLPTIGASMIFYPLLSWYAGAAGAGIGTLLTCTVWLGAYFVYYVKFMRESQNNE